MTANGFSSNKAYSLWKAFESAILNRDNQQFELYSAYAKVVRADSKSKQNSFDKSGELIP